MIPKETVDSILDAVRIEDVVGDYVTLRRRGVNFVACCPFHNEKTPSFYVSPVKGLYKCFGCGKSGSAVGFVMESEHCTYPEALRLLAKKYHIEINEEEESAEEIALRQHRESLMLVMDFAQKFFAAQLSTTEGRAVGYAYLKSRGIEDGTIEKFGLGWAPSGKTGLIDAALAAGYRMEYLLDAGLAVQKEDGSVADKFRERVMFPIHTVSGRVIAFSGRTLRSDNPAKYVNSPETEIYHKSSTLLGIYFAKPEIARRHKCILVEGNVDMVMMYQLGIQNVVASCGTSLTVEQVKLIKRFAMDDVTIMYDGDSAGIHAAMKGISLVLREGLNVKIVLLPEGEDPDSFSRKHNLQQVEDYIDRNEQDFIEFKAQFLAAEAGRDPIKRANLINDIADTIADIPDAVKRSVYVEDCSVKFGIDSQLLYDRIGKIRKTVRESSSRQQERDASLARMEQEMMEQQTNPDTRPVENGPVEERDLLYFLLQHGRQPLNFPTDSDYADPDGNVTEVAEFIRQALDDSQFVYPLYRSLYEQYFALYDENMPQEKILRAILDSPDRQIASLAAGLSTQTYQLTVRNFEKALTATESWLVNFVPKSILLYHLHKVQCDIDSLREQMKQLDTNGQFEVMKKIVNLEEIQKKIKNKYGKRI